MITLGFITAQDQDSGGTPSPREEAPVYRPPLVPTTNPSTAIQNILTEQQQAANEARIDAQQPAPLITAIAAKPSHVGYIILGVVGAAVITAGVIGLRMSLKKKDKPTNASV